MVPYFRFLPESTYNMDETFVSAENHKFTVVVPKSARKAVCGEKGHFNHHMTLVMCVSADGFALPVPTIVLPLTTLPALSHVVYKAFNFAGSETGWITSEIWGKWIVEVFIPSVNEKRMERLFAKSVLSIWRSTENLLAWTC